MIVSFITTVRNEQGTIGPYLESLARQSRRPDEVVIVDAQSTDGTVGEIEARAGLFSRLRVIVRPCNIAAGRNLAVLESSGEIIVMSDAGCVLADDWLEEIVRPLETRDGCGASAGNWSIERAAGFQDLCRWYFLQGRPGMRDGPLSPLNFSARSFAIRRELWLEMGGHPEFLHAGEDTLFNTKLSLRKRPVAFAEAAMCRWVMHRTLSGLGRQVLNYARAGGRLARTDAIADLIYHVRALFVYSTILLAVGLDLLALRGWAISGRVALMAIVSVVVFRKKGEGYRRARRYGLGRLMSMKAIMLIEYCNILQAWGTVIGLADRTGTDYNRLIMEYCLKTWEAPSEMTPSDARAATFSGPAPRRVVERA